MNLETGEALVSFLDEKGAPGMVQRAKILFPLSQIGAITEGQRMDIIKQSRVYGKYDTPVDNESAFEILIKEAEEALAVQEAEKQAIEEAKEDKKSSKKQGVMGKVVKAIITAVTGTLSAGNGCLDVNFIV